MARPLRKSLAEHIQLLGRGLRMAPGKEDCLVLDHSGNCARFFAECEEFFDVGLSELDDGKGRNKSRPKPPKEREPVKCPECKGLHPPMPACPCCGHEYPKKQGIMHVPGTLKELVTGGHKKQLIEAVWPMVCAEVAKTRDGVAANRQALAIFKDMTGIWPPRGTDFFNTNRIEPTAEVKAQIQHVRIRYAKARNAGMGARA